MKSVLEVVDENQDISPSLCLKFFTKWEVYSDHVGRQKSYLVVGITDRPISEIVSMGESMSDFFLQHFGIVLKRTDLPAFKCEGGMLLPPEICMSDWE